MRVIRKLIRMIFSVSLVGGCVIGATVFPANAKEVSFSRDVFPILSARCFACHGPDAHDRKAKLRLDLADGPDGAYRTHEDVTAIKPGSLEDSELWYRITTDDPDELMPPAKAHKKPLTKEEQSVIKRWIEAGATYERFWAFVSPKKPKAPKLKNSKWSNLPIDRLVLAQLESLNLQPAKEADKRTLIRRIAFDLTGLPPTGGNPGILGRRSPRSVRGSSRPIVDQETIRRAPCPLLVGLGALCRHQRHAQGLLPKFHRLPRLGDPSF